MRLAYSSVALCSGPESNRRAIPVDKVALPLSYPSMCRVDRRPGLPSFRAVRQVPIRRTHAQVS